MKDLKPHFEKSADGLIPAIVQDSISKNVLMLGYMNQNALDQTLLSGKVTFYSRSRKTIWTKGETSGNFLEFKSARLDCDQDTLLILAQPQGPTCHLGTATCFGDHPNSSTDLGFLDQVISDRKDNPKEGSYTNFLLSNINKAAQKVGEEAVETVIEAKDDNRELFLNESADLLYHLMVLIQAKGLSLSDVVDVLRNRRNG